MEVMAKSNPVVFFVDSDPTPQPRHRFALPKNATSQILRGKSVKPRAYLPKDHPIHAFKSLVQIRAKVARPSVWPLKGPVVLNVIYLLNMPASIRKKTGELRRTWAYNARSYKDLDNLTKAVQDALTGIAWIDDAQVCQTFQRKFWASAVESPGVWIEIDALG